MPFQIFEPSIQTISAGSSWASGPGISFANSNNITFGISGNTITASVNAGGGADVPVYAVTQWGGFDTNYSVLHGQISFQKMSMPMPILAASGIVLLDLSGHSNSSGGVTIYVAAYAVSAGTASAITTGSGGFTWASGSATSANSLYGGASGTRFRTFDWPISVTQGDYLFGIAVSTQNDGTIRLFGRHGVNIVGNFAGAETVLFLDGVSASTAATFPTTLAATNSNYVRTGLQAAQQPGFILVGT